MAKILKRLLILVLFVLVVFQAGFVLAAYERYAVGDDVTIGEFVYDDDFVATTTPCWVTITSPTSTVVVNEAEMTNGDRGWHYYSFPIVYANGIWPTVMTCGSSTTGDLAKLDKTFVVGNLSMDTGGLATQADITALTSLVNSASSSLAIIIPSSINSTVANASSSLFALLSGLMAVNTETITSQITNASSSLYSTLNASLLNASSSLAALIAGIIPTDISGLVIQIDNASSSLATLITATGDALGDKIESASSSLAGQTAINGSLDSWNVFMSNVDRVLIGEQYKAKIYVTNYKTVATNSSVAPKISLYNNNGNLVTENISMSLGTSTGTYYYSYTIPDLAEGLWEAEVKTEVETGKIITTNDYFAIEGSPAEVRINTVSDAVSVTGGLEVTANVTITNEGNADYEYHYEWCTVSDVSYICRDGHDLFYGSNSKLLEVGSSTSANLTATVPSAGNYYFKLIVYYGMEKSGASRYFTATVPVTPPTCGNGSCSGGETCSSCPADCGTCPSTGGGGGGGGPVIPPIEVPVATCNGADFNHDKIVNSVDFSILLAFWRTIWPFKNPCVDINKDKQVNSVDFSILMYQWGNKSL